MQQVLDVFCVVEGCRGVGRLGGLFLAAWFARVDSFPDAEFAEVGERDLQFSHGLGSGDEVLGLTGGSFLLNSTHCCGFGAFWRRLWEIVGLAELFKKKVLGWSELWQNPLTALTHAPVRLTKERTESRLLLG